MPERQAKTLSSRVHVQCVALSGRVSTFHLACRRAAVNCHRAATKKIFASHTLKTTMNVLVLQNLASSPVLELVGLFSCVHVHIHVHVSTKWKQVGDDEEFKPRVWCEGRSLVTTVSPNWQHTHLIYHPTCTHIYYVYM